MKLLRRHMFRTIAASVAAIFLSTAMLSGTAAAEEKVTVFAAASMKNALDAINAEWAKETKNKTVVSCSQLRTGKADRSWRSG